MENICNSHFKLETVSCAICGSSDYSIVMSQVKESYNNMPYYFNIVRCNVCGLYFTNPRPTMDSISFFYPNSAGYFQENYENFDRNKSFYRYLQQYRGYPGGRKLSFLQYCLLPYYRLRADIGSYSQFTGGRLLDVGCSYGKYLAEMKQLGWQTFGIEPHIPAARKAQSWGEIHIGTIDDAPWPDKYFDVITLNMSLEHIHYPQKALGRIAQLLSPSGTVIISVPDFSGFEFSLFKENSYALQVPQHLYHFTPSTLNKLVSKVGFRYSKVCHHYFDRDLIVPIEKKLPYLGKILKINYIRKFILKPFLILIAFLGKTSRMTIYLVRK